MPNLITSDVPTSVSLIATAGQTVFSFGFPIFELSDLVVQIDGVLTAPVSISGVGSPSGGSILLTPRTAGQVIQIARVIPVRRSVDLPTVGPYSSDDIDTEFDRIFAIAQELNESDDSQQAAIESFSARVAVAEARPLIPGPTGAAGQPGGNILAIGRFVDLPTLTIPGAAAQIRTTGVAEASYGAAYYRKMDDAEADPLLALKGITWNTDLSGARYTLYEKQKLDCFMFGARALGVTFDDAVAIKNLQLWLGENGQTETLFWPRIGKPRGGRPITGDRFYYFATPAELTKPIVLEGTQGGAASGGVFPGSVIYTAPGVTAILGDRGPGFNVSDAWSWKNLQTTPLNPAANLTTTSRGTGVHSGTYIDLTTPGDWQVDQIGLIRGGGYPTIFRASRHWHGTCNIGDNRIAIAKATGGDGVFPLGFVLNVGGYINDGAHGQYLDGAFPDNTYVTGIQETFPDSGVFTYLMSNNATKTVTAAARSPVVYWEDIPFRILSIGTAPDGKQRLNLDSPWHTKNIAADHFILHYDSGIYTNTRFLMEGVNNLSGFGGAGIVINADSGRPSKYGRDQNANQCTIMGICYLSNCRNGITIKGADANAGRFHGLDMFENSEYCYNDISFLGNLISGGHCSNAYGYRTTNINASSVFIGCYTEGGTQNTFASNTSGFGGFMGSDTANETGGVWFAANSGRMTLPPSNWYTPNGTMQARTGDEEGLIYADFSKKGGSPAVFLFRYEDVGSNHPYTFGIFNNDNSSWAIQFSDKNHPKGAGHTFFPLGYHVGTGGGAELSNMRLRRIGTAAPVSGTWTQGDKIENSAPAVGQPTAWYCTVSGSPGTWVAGAVL